jgi:hypothetical protein
MKENNMKENLENWVFVYSTYTEEWLSTTRDNVKELWNNSDSKNIIRSSSISTLEKLIIRYGTIEKIRKAI